MKEHRPQFAPHVVGKYEERSIDPETLDLLVPNLILQPLVENAVRHGIAPHAVGGRIEVGARVENGCLRIDVFDDGQGSKGEIREGVGISRTRARLDRLYGSGSCLEMHNGPRGGFQVRLTIPMRPEAGNENEAGDENSHRG